MPQSPASVERPSAAERSEAERAETARRFGLGGLLWDTLTQSKTDNDSALPPTETHRNGDDRYVRIGREKVHARGREVVVHPEVLEADPAIWQAISEAMEAMGADPSQAIIGSPTGNYGADGNQEFFVHKRVGKFFKKNPWAGMLATAATAMIPGVGPWLAPIVAGGTTALSGGGVFESLGAAAGSAAGSYFGSTSSGLGGVTAGGQEGTVFNTLAESAAGDGFFSGVSQFAGDALHGSLGAAIGSANVGALVGGGLGASFGASLGALADGPGAAPQGAPLNFNTNETITGPVSLPGDPIGLNNAGLGTGPVEDTTPDLPINQQPNLIEDAPQAFSPYGVKYLQRRKDRNTGRAVFNVVSGPNNQYNRLVRRGFGMGVNFV